MKYFVSFISFFFVFFVFSESVHAADVTSEYVHVSTYTPLSPQLWQNLQNITAFDNTFATCTGTDNCVLNTRYNWLGIPSGASIKSFDIKVRGYHPRVQFNGGSLHALLKKGCALPENSSNTLTAFQTEFNSWLNLHIDSTINLSGQDLANNNYCIQIWAGNASNGTWYIDDTQARVTYSGPVEPTATPTPTNIPTPTPTPTPTPIPTPEPFLDLPWDYEGKGLTFEKAALEINSYFDHEYPLLSKGLALPEPNFAKNSTVPYFGYPRLNIPEDDIWYSSHDGYDYGSNAKVYNGDLVYSAASGIATYKKDRWGGNTIFIDHQNGYQTVYYHLQDVGLITSQPGLGVYVDRSTPIGRVGSTGEHTTGPHIHIGVFEDKNHDGNFADNIPDGATDPFGWQSEDLDPWEHYTFFYNGQQRTGNKSYYLWKKKIPGIKEVVTSAGGTYTAGDVSIEVDQDTFVTPVTLDMHYAPREKVSDSFWSVGPVVSVTAKNIFGDLVILFTKPVKLIWIPFRESELSRFKVGSFYIYSTKDGNEWKKEQQVDPFTPGNITAIASHFTYFAIMGERKDIIPPVTTAYLDGDEGEEKWFRSDVTLSLLAEDTADEDPAGVEYILYRIDREGEDWQTYEQPLTFSEEGHHNILFYAGDKDGNVEEVKVISFDIDKTLPQVSIDANPKIFWPPNGRMVDVTVTGSSNDENIVGTVFAVDDEYDLIEPEFTGFGQTIKLQASKDGYDTDGRNYIISATIKDKAGNESTASVGVLVPHDQGRQ